MATKRSANASPRILFLTSKLGYGHTRAADAIKQALTESVPQAEIHYLDFWSLMDQRVADAVKDGYLRMTRKYPEHYQRLYDLDRGLWRQLSGIEPAEEAIKEFLAAHQKRWFPHEAYWFGARGRNIDRALINSLISLLCRDDAVPSQKVVMRSLLMLMRTVLLNRMKERLQTLAPDIVVATQMYPAALVGQLKQRGHFPSVPTVGILTDYGLQTIWVNPPADHYCVGSADLYQQLAGQGVPERRIHCTGIPLMPQFTHPPAAQDARRQLNLDPRSKTVLITGGQYGIGLTKAVSDLVRSGQDYQILVAAGRSSQETADLESLARYYQGRIRVFDWVTDMSVLLSAADVVLGKPGGLSVSEALACGRPFYATCCLGGQERHNVNYLQRERIGGALPVAKIAEKLTQLYHKPGLLVQLQQRAWAHGHRYGALHIAKLIQQQLRSQHGNEEQRHDRF